MEFMINTIASNNYKSMFCRHATSYNRLGHDENSNGCLGLWCPSLVITSKTPESWEGFCGVEFPIKFKTQLKQLKERK